MYWAPFGRSGPFDLHKSHGTVIRIPESEGQGSGSSSLTADVLSGGALDPGARGRGLPAGLHFEPPDQRTQPLSLIVEVARRR